MKSLLLDKTKIFLFNRSTFSTSDAQKRASKEGSPFALPLSKKSTSLPCLLLGLCAIITPLLTAENIKDKEDGFDNDTIQEELDGNI
ncbi:MAG: hypothetical protein AAF335_02590 [Bacteroidota bacterium]